MEINLRKRLLVGVLYSPPSFNYFQEFDSVMSELLPYYPDVVMMGDLNTCMLQSTNRSKILCNIFNSYNLYLVNKEPTHHLPNSSTLLDLIVTSSPNKIYTHGQRDAYQFSHHNLIFAALNFKRPKKKPLVINCRNLTNIDKTVFQQEISKVDWNPLYRMPTVDPKLNILTQTF